MVPASSAVLPSSGVDVATVIPGRVVSVAVPAPSSEASVSLSAAWTVVGEAAGAGSRVGVSVPRNK